MRWLVVIVVAACGAQPAPPPPTLTRTPVVTPPPPAPITCGDAAVILRGHVEDEREAGPLKEEAIAKACLHEKWSQEIIDCVGSTTKPKSCLDKLEAAQRTRYRERLTAWNDAFPDEALDEDTVDHEPPEFIACGDALGDVSQYSPPLALKGKDRELAIAMRRGELLAQCAAWSTELRRCFREHSSDQCRALLEPLQKQLVTGALARIDELFARIVKLDPKAITCKKVVEVHYGDARWKGRLDAMKPAERRKIIAESRARMTKACNDDAWSSSLRGCIVEQGAEACFIASSITPGTWGYPPSGIPFKTGIAECDGYADDLRAFATCKQIPAQVAQTMLDAYHQQINATTDRTVAARFCTQADSSLRQSARSLGCTI